jgi:hypothetical protein
MRNALLLTMLSLIASCGEPPGPITTEDPSTLTEDAGVFERSTSEDKARFTYARCINGCWRAERYCRDHQSHMYNCPSMLGHCFDWCDEVLLGD